MESRTHEKQVKLHPVFGQLMRYGLVGIVSNLVLYLLFVLLNTLGMQHMLAMTLCFVTGCVVTFFMHNYFSFRSGMPDRKVFLKYGLLYISAYALNYAGLWVGVDTLGYDARLVQIVMIVLVALYLFVLMRLLVFKPSVGSAS